MGILTTAVYFGIAVGIITFLFNVFHKILADIFGIRIEIFAVFFPLIRAYMFKFYRNETSYRVGFLPLGGFVRHSGMLGDSLDESQVIADHMLASKSTSVKYICILGAPVLLLIPFVISAIFIDPNASITTGFQVIGDVLFNLYEYMFSIINSETATANWNAISQGFHVFPIIYCIMSLFVAISSILTSLQYFLPQKETLLDKIKDVIMGVLSIYFAYKGITLYFSVCGFSGGLINVFKMTITAYAILCPVMLLIKFLPKNKYI